MKNSKCVCGGSCGMCGIISFEDNSIPTPGKQGCSCSDITVSSNGMITPPSNQDG